MTLRTVRELGVRSLASDLSHSSGLSFSVKIRGVGIEQEKHP
jgi:hypothetical protein